jgi:hypothetical protein
MGTDQQHRAELWVLMQARRLGLGRNPLRRSTDRLEATFVILAFLTGLLMVPIGAAAGTAVRNASEHRAAQQRILLEQVQATTTEDTPILTGQEIGQISWPVGVAYKDAAGVDRRARVDVAIGTRANSPVIIWLDRSGRIVKPPRPAGDSAAIGGVAGFATVTGSWLVLWLLVLVARRPLNRRRLLQWTAEWEKVAPLWTRREH